MTDDTRPTEDETPDETEELAGDLKEATDEARKPDATQTVDELEEVIDENAPPK